MDDESRRQAIPSCELGVPGVAATEPTALFEQFRPRGPVNRPSTPLARSDVLAAFTIASTASVVMSARTARIGGAPLLLQDRGAVFRCEHDHRIAALADVAAAHSGRVERHDDSTQPFRPMTPPSPLRASAHLDDLVCGLLGSCAAILHACADVVGDRKPDESSPIPVDEIAQL